MKSKPRPRISVILPSYNAERYIVEAIDSVLRQSFSNFELLVIDDGSSDRSAELVERFDDDRVYLHRKECNTGIIGTLNLGIELARGEFIARMDADDVSIGTRFAQQIAHMDNHPSVGVLGTNFTIIDDSGRLGRSVSMPVKNIDTFWSMPFQSPVAHPTVMMRSSLVRQVGGYRESAKYAEDYDLWCRLSRVTKIENLDAPLLLLRKHSENVTSTNYRKHVDAATAIASEEVAQRLGRHLSIETVECIRSRGAQKRNHAEEAMKLVMKMYRDLESREGTLTDFIRKDAALRLLGYFAFTMRIRTARGLVEAVKIYPRVFSLACHKIVSKLLRW